MGCRPDATLECCFCSSAFRQREPGPLQETAKRAHVGRGDFILEKDGIPVIGIMDADELEDYLELRDPKVKAKIRQSNQDIRAGRTRPAEALLHELLATSAKPSLRRSK